MIISALLSIMVLITISAKQNSQCLDDLQIKFKSGQIYNKNDDSCYVAFTEFFICASQCQFENKNSENTLNCIQENCSSSIPIIQQTSNDLQSCMKKSTPQCENDLMKKYEQGQVCNQDDSNCITALDTFYNCFQNCKLANQNDEAKAVQCSQRFCTSSNLKVLQKKIESGQICDIIDTNCNDALLKFSSCLQKCHESNQNDYTKIGSCIQQMCQSSNSKIQQLLNDLQKCIQSTSDKPYIQQCEQDLMKKIEQGQVCDQVDNDCITALASFSNCFKSCQGQNQNDQIKTAQCIQLNCQSSNPTVQSFSIDLQKCMQSTSDKPQKPQCEQSLLKKMEERKICNKGDTDCISALVSFQNCFQNCEYSSLNDQTKIVACAQTTCKSSNSKVQLLLSELIKCIQSSNSSRNLTGSQTLFSLLILLILSLLIL
ncbi:hypothetical protein ABPG73_018762 [Tetrahymena malaccensis]